MPLATLLQYLIPALIILLILYLIFSNMGGSRALTSAGISAANTSLTAIKTTLQTIANRPSMLDSKDVIQRLIDQLQQAHTQFKEGVDEKAFDCKTAADFAQKMAELLTVYDGMDNAGMFPDSDADDADLNEQELRLRQVQAEITRLKELLDKLQAAIELCKKIRLALGILNGTAGGNLDNDAKVTAIDEGVAAAGQIPDEPVIHDLPEAAQELQQEVASRPTLSGENAEVTSTSVLAECDQDQDVRNIAFGDSNGITLAPGCCLVVRFSPKLEDNWEYSHGDVEISVSDGAAYSVEGKARSRDADSSYSPLASDSGNTWEIPGADTEMRFIRICNTGDAAMTVTQIKRR